MTDEEMIQYAISELKLTTVGYINKRWKTPPPGTHWANGLDALNKLLSGGTVPAPTPTPTPAPTPTPTPTPVPVPTADITLHPGDDLTSALKNGGKTILLAPGNYGSSSSKWYATASGVTLVGQPGAYVRGQLKVTADMTLRSVIFAGPSPGASDTLVWISGGARVSLIGCELHDSSARSAMFVDGQSHFTVDNCNFHDNGIFGSDTDPLNGERNNNLDHHIYVSDCADGLIQNSMFKRARAFGIQIYPNACHNVMIRGNIIDDCGQAGIVLDADMQNVFVAGNTIKNVGREGDKRSIQVSNYSGKTKAGTFTILNNITDAPLDIRV